MTGHGNHRDGAARRIPPTRDPFYEQPGEVPDHPGRLLRRREVQVESAVAAEACQLVYSTVASDGRIIAASGTVLVPRGPWPGRGPRPVVSYGVCLHGLGRDNAPSHLLADGRESEIAVIEQALGRGWAVLVADGEGLGMPGPHTYGAGRVGGRAMLDIVRAARDVTPDVDADAPVLLWGYSEGGRNAAWAAELQPEYAPDVSLVGLAAGGVPTDLTAVVQAIDGGFYSGLGLAVLVGLAHAYRDERLWRILNERGLAAATVAATLDVVGLVLTHPQPLASHTVRERPWEEPIWSALLESERNPAAAPRVPVLIYHSSADDIIPLHLSSDLAAAYEAMGARVVFAEIDSPDHLSGVADGAAPALKWLAGCLADTWS